MDVVQLQGALVGDTTAHSKLIPAGQYRQSGSDRFFFSPLSLDPTMWTLSLVLLAISLAGCSYAAQLEDVFAWNQLDFQWPDEATKQSYIEAKKYVPENNLPLGLSRWKDKLFVTVPR